MIHVEGIFSGGGVPSLQSKSVAYTKNGTATITPDDGYDGLSSVDVTVNVSGGSAPSRQAKLTITSTDYTGDCYGLFIFVNSEGHLVRLQHLYGEGPFTFPITIETVLGGMVVFIPDGFPGIPLFGNPIGCEADKYQHIFCVLVTNPQASVDIGNAD